MFMKPTLCCAAGTLPAGDFGGWGTAGAASAGAANRLFDGDLHSSLDDSLYSEGYRSALCA